MVEILSAKVRDDETSPPALETSALPETMFCVTMDEAADMNSKFDAFVAAQDGVYERVLEELRHGRKETHWIWFIFPQLQGLGFSAMSRKFGIESLDEARRYLAHPTLGPRLLECTRLMLAPPSGTPVGAVLPYPDDLKFRSSMTLFAAAAAAAQGHERKIFQDALDKYFGGERDGGTLALLARKSGEK